MNHIIKASNLFIALTLAVTLTAHTALAETTFNYTMNPVSLQTVYPVDNSGTFGMSVEDFRDLCNVTGGEWDVISGRHICHCWEGEFNWPNGCPETDYYYGDDYYYGNDYYGDDTPFWDLAGHPDEYYILQLYEMGIIQGYPDGSFRPDQPVTRAEMTKMALMAANLRPLDCDDDRNMFFADLDNWQAPWVNAAYRLDIVEGYSGHDSGIRLFKPNNLVNRVEGVKLVDSAFGRRPLDFDKTSFTDASGWMIPWLEDAYRIGLIDRDFNGRFYPAEPMTRGTAARVIVKMLQYSGDI